MASKTYTYNDNDGKVYKVKIYKSHYLVGGRTMLQLNDDKGYPFAVATVNLPDATLSGKEVIIKDYSENEGMLNFLQQNGIVGQVKRYVPTGYVICPVVDLLKEDFEELEDQF